MSGTMNAAINITVNAVNLASIAAIRGAFAGLRASVDGVIAGMQGANRVVTNLDNSIRTLDRTMKYLIGGALIAASHSFIKMMSDLEKLGITLGTIENSFDKASIALDRMLVLSQRTPYTLNTIHEAFVKLRSAGIEPIIDAQGNGPLKNLLDAVAAFGGSDEQVKRVALALEQMAGKGVVSMEELRRQMGQQIPTAIRLMAEGMGISVAKLIADISKGVVTFESAVLPMLDKFKEKYGGAGDLLATSFEGAIRQVSNEVKTFAATLNRAGVLDVFTTAIHYARDALRSLNSAATVGAVKEWLAGVLAFAERNAAAFAHALLTIREFGTAFATIVGAIFNSLSEMPAEAVAGGILGFLIFGRIGLVAGAILGPATGVVQGVANAIAGLFTFLAGAIGALGMDASNLAVYGIIGWLLFGRMGLLAGVLLELVDRIVGGIRTNLAKMFGDIAGLAAAVQDPFNFGSAYTEGKKGFLERNTNNPANPKGGEGFFGFGDITKNPMQEYFDSQKTGSKAATSDSVRSITESLKGLNAQLGETRAKFDGTFGQVNDIPGIPQSVMRSMERFGEALVGVDARLKGAEGNPIDAWVARQQHVAEKFQSQVIDPLQKSMETFLAKGDSKNAEAVAKSLTDARATLDQFNASVNKTAELERGKIGARIGARAEGVLGRLGNSLDQMTQQLDAFEARFTEGKISAEAEGAKAFAQFAPMVKQLENAKLAISQLKGAEGDRAAALEEIIAIEERLNRVREMAVAIAIRKAAREKEDGIRDAFRSVRTLSGQARMADLETTPFGEAASAQIARMEAAAAQVDQVNDKIIEMKRRLEDTPGDTWLVTFIDALEAVRGKFEQIRDIAGTTADATNRIATELGSNVASALEDGLGNSIEALITGTKKLGDVVKTMYAEITRAAIQYLMKQALVAAGSPDGSLGGFFGSLGGSSGGGGGGGGWLSSLGSLFSGGGGTDVIGADIIQNLAMMPSAMGNVFQKFANGGGFTNSVVRGPTTFPIGVMGEAGPEGILPLANVNGKLGVHTSGNGGGDHYTINISAVDATSVQRLFYENGAALIDTLRHRDRLNRGFSRR